MTWDTFLGEVSEVAGIEKKNLAIASMTWNFQKCLLLLANEEGYKAMIQQIRILRDPAAAIIVVSIPAPKSTRVAHTTMEADVENHKDNNSIWGKKVCTCVHIHLDTM